MTLVPDVHKIAILNAKAIGEFTFVLPAIQSLKEAYPESELVLLAKPWHKAFFDGRPGPIDRTVVMPPMPGLVLPGETFVPDETVEAFFAEMRGEAFDLALQLHGPGEHANPVVARLGARLTVGCHGDTALRLDCSLAHIATQHEVFRWLEVVEQVGANATLWEPSLALTEEDEELAAAVLPASAGLLAAISPGAVLRRHQWATGNFAYIGERLAELGLQVLLVGSEGDTPQAANIQGAMKHHPIDLTGKLSNRALAGVLARCRLVVGSDSDALRLARVLHVPTVGVYWAGNLLNVDPLRRNHHRQAISWRTSCPVCGVELVTGRCTHEDSLVADVPEEEVLRLAIALLEETGQ